MWLLLSRIAIYSLAIPAALYLGADVNYEAETITFTFAGLMNALAGVPVIVATFWASRKAKVK